MEQRIDDLKSPKTLGVSHLALVAMLGVLVLVSSACAAFRDTDAENVLSEITRDARAEGDREGYVGDELEVYTVTATVLSVKRVQSYGELDSRGYIEAEIRIDNPSSRTVEFKRSDWRLEKPDGTLSNTASVTDRVQLRDDSIAPGNSVEGTLIYTAGNTSGQFAIVFNPQYLKPDDPLQAERGVWVFESDPGDDT